MLTRVSLYCFAVPALLAGLLLGFGTTAHADAPVSPQWSGYGTGRTVIAGQAASVVTTPADRRVVTLTTKERAYATYRVVVRGNKSGEIFLDSTLSPWRTWWATAAFNTGRSLGRVPAVNAEKPSTFSISELRRLSQHLKRASISDLRAEHISFFKEFNTEDGILYGPTGDAAEKVRKWVYAHPKADDFSDFDGDLTGTIGYPTLPPWSLSLRGDPSNFQVRGSLADDGWVSMGCTIRAGKCLLLPAASMHSAEANGMYAWLRAHR